ncbi:filamentous hemagglutinin N-terminal domain-containing protein [Nostoc parmelioides]|uniref:Filamentous hemagglutinin N-terminal domain-containing protein n=1 Tax=Nostoc parmelioides FACHB-3921 TaxID=2692909 RepID=A0ABR8BMP3_9NOSO|nr:filamentous hemagglutinin N-terminal domain-containing protein [Nostoc parmelioides]MBD2255151.1 filamentous hemagglutinin N-terminal domain-containing protein [Nostoc parmelioides FACHB-3921]
MTTSPSNAQVIPDATLPNNTTIKINGSAINIEGGTQLGNNLFHSLKDFSVLTGSTVHFNNASDIQNIITRITGGSVSNIDGLISANGTANLFLINPSGIVFGTNARLDIGGSLFATTADSLEFANGSEFSAVNPQQTLLTVDIPIGLRFNGNSGSITVQGTGEGLKEPNAVFIPTIPNDNSPSLSISQQQTLALLGNKIVLEGVNLISQGGNIELGSINSGSVSLISNSVNWSFKYGGVSKFNDIDISKQALINASGNPGGFVQLHGANITLQDGSIILIQNLGDSPSGNININASASLVIEKTSLDGNISSSLLAESLNSGKAGDIRISTQKLSLQDGARINSTTYSDGSGGSVIIDTSNSLDLLPNRFANPFRRGDIINTLGSVTVSRGNAGIVQVSTDKLYISDGGAIASSTFSSGNGNIVTVNANSIEINGIKVERFAQSNIGSATFNSGNAGVVNINTSTLKIRDGGIVNSASLASGDAGSVNINARESVEVAGGTNSQFSFVSSSANTVNEAVRRIFNLPAIPSGSSGDVIINTKNFNISQGAFVSVGNAGTGNAGNISITTNILKLEAGNINATTTSGEGGNINLKAENVQLSDGFISATAGTNGSTGNGGNIAIETGALILQSNSQITANAFEGSGGNIKINSPGLFASPDSQIRATSERGVNGSVQVNTTQIDVVNSGIRNSVFQSPQSFNTCSPEPPNLPTKLTISGRGGLPVSLDDLFTTALGWTDLSAPISPQQLPQSTQTNNTENIVVAQGWHNNGDGTVSFVITPDPTDEISAYTSPSRSSCIKRVPDVGG